jgi:adenine-specific DNA-methyltransferase
MDPFIYQTMLTCIGNKRKLVGNIKDILNDLKGSKEKLNILDAFAGSSVVSRGLCSISDVLYTNDLEYYSYLMAKCYLITPNELQKIEIIKFIDKLNDIAINGPYTEGIICKLYSPKVTNDIKMNERCFYTRENALIIDSLRKYITDHVPEELFCYCIVPLLNKASIHTNTCGVFKGFYKKDGLGCFGGAGKNALSRIMKNITLDIPIWTDCQFKSMCYNKDINILINELPDNIDVIYLDPPYNQHPYGSNYFMLNVIAKNEEPVDISKVSGIPVNWNKSNYNTYNKAILSMTELLNKGLTKAKYIVLSYNNEGTIKGSDFDVIFKKFNVIKKEIIYNTYKGSRNLKERSDKVIEYLYIITKLSDQ